MSCEFKGSVSAYGGQAILKSDMTLASTRIVRELSLWFGGVP
jgi:hypothetical protein